MIESIVLIVSQLVFSFCRTLNVRYTAKGKVLMSIITSTLIKTTWLISSYLGINAIINGDYLTAIIYVVSGLIGDYLSFKVKIK